MVQEKEQLRAKPINIARTKAYLLQQKDSAKQACDNEEVKRIEEELQSLEELDKRETERAAKKKLKVADINKKNKQKNMEAVPADTNAKLAGSDTVIASDPFSRRPTAPILIVRPKKEVPGTPVPSSSSASLLSNTPQSSPAPISPSLPTKSPSSSLNGKLSSAKNGKEVISKGQSHKEETDNKGKRDSETDTNLNPIPSASDLDIDIDIDIDIDLSAPLHKAPPSSTGGFTPSPALPKRHNASANGSPSLSSPKTPIVKQLSLDDYKRRRGLL